MDNDDNVSNFAQSSLMSLNSDLCSDITDTFSENGSELESYISEQVNINYLWTKILYIKSLV